MKGLRPAAALLLLLAGVLLSAVAAQELAEATRLIVRRPDQSAETDDALVMRANGMPDVLARTFQRGTVLHNQWSKVRRSRLPLQQLQHQPASLAPSDARCCRSCCP